jgi:hypothetical protein
MDKQATSRNAIRALQLGQPAVPETIGAGPRKPNPSSPHKSARNRLLGRDRTTGLALLLLLLQIRPIRITIAS